MAFEIRDGIVLKYIPEDGETTAIIPKTVTVIGEQAFGGCAQLTEIVIPDGIVSISSGAFRKCESLTSVTLPEGITTIHPYTFSNCTNLTSIRIPEGVTCIDAGAFYNCRNLVQVEFPQSLRVIRREIFEKCRSLMEIVVPPDVDIIEDKAFYGCDPVRLTLPEGVPFAFGKICNSIALSEVTIGERTIILTPLDMWETGHHWREAWDMVLAKDFARKFSHKVKYKILLDFLFSTGDEEAVSYLKKSFMKIMKQLIEENDLLRIRKLMERTDFITKRNIDKCLEYAIGQGRIEIQIELLHYKSETIGYRDPSAEFEL